MGTFAKGVHCYVSLPPHQKKWPTSCRLSILNWYFLVTHPLAPFCSRSEAYSQFPCMSHNSRGKGQRVAIRWMRRPISVLIWIIQAVGGSYFETHKLILFRFEACLEAVYWRFVFCRCRAIFALPCANSNSQGQDNPKTGRKGKRHLRIAMSEFKQPGTGQPSDRKY